MFDWNVTNLVNSAELMKKVTNDGGKVVVRIDRGCEFLEEKIKKVYKNPYVDPVAGKAEITLPSGSAGELYRIKLYVRLSGSQNSYYANSLVFKGKPFVYEYKGGQDAAKVASVIKKINAAYDDRFLKVAEAEGKLVFTGDNYTNFTEAVVEKFEADGASTISLNGGKWVDQEATVTITKCHNGFGTYEQILKDLRLPTLDNTNWTSPNASEMPVPGLKYTQYTIEYENEVGVQGAGHIGDVVTARTTHVFYMPEAVGTEFEKLVSVTPVTKVTVPQQVTLPEEEDELTD